MNDLLFFLIFFLLAAVSLSFGEGTRTWEQSKFDDLSKGTATGVAIRSIGGLELAPSVKALSTTPSTYIWSIAADQSGNLYAATGAPARVYRITPQGQSTTIFEPKELQVQALAVDKNGVLYAATNPDGKVYRIEHMVGAAAANAAGKEKSESDKTKSASEFSASVFFDPGTKYIWDLVFDSSGNLFVATGDHGEIFRVTPKGEHSVFFKSDEAHIRVLALDAKSNLIAGSDGSGLVYQIKPDGQGFVLYSAPKKEITALAIDTAGNIYAAGGGEKRAGSAPAIFPSSTIPVSTASPTTGPPPQSGMVILNAGSFRFRIDWRHPVSRSWLNRRFGNLSHCTGRVSQPNLEFSSRPGVRPRIRPGWTVAGGHGKSWSYFCGYRRRSVCRSAEGQCVASYGICRRAGRRVVSSPPAISGKLFLLGGSSESEGTYESDVFDAKVFSRWGRAQFRGAGNVALFARSGNVDNPDRNWSQWKTVDLQKDPLLNVPAGEVRAMEGRTSCRNSAPSVDSVLLNYLPKNVAPDFDDVTVQVGVRYQALPKPAGVPDAAGAGRERDPF